MVDPLTAIVLGIIQGITEWLPISSSGHLILAEKALQTEIPLIFQVGLHVGTLIVLIHVFRREILRVILAFVATLGDLLRGKSFRYALREEERWLALLIILGSIPTAFIGYLVDRYGVKLLHMTALVGICFLITGILLFSTRRCIAKKHSLKKVTVMDGILIGVTQGISVLPGISRSGSTISAGILKSIDRNLAVKFSFLLSIPAVLGALLLHIKDALTEAASMDFTFFIGIVVSAIVGYLSIKSLIELVRRRKLHLFSFYCWGIGLIILICALVLGV